MLATRPRAGRIPGFAPFLLAPLLVAACTTPDTYAARSPTATFAAYKTYAQEAGPRGLTPPPATWAEVQADVDRELAKKGYAPAQGSAAPDLVVRAGSASRTVEDADWVSFDRVVEYTPDTLVIEVFDARTRAPVWHGSSRGALGTETAAPDSASLARAVQATLEPFPRMGVAPPP